MKKITMAFLLIVIAIITLHKKEKEIEINNDKIDNSYIIKEDPITQEDTKEEKINVEPPKEEKKLDYFSSYQEALSESKSSHKKMLLFFEASWCHWCSKMKVETIFNADVKKSILENYVVCIIDIDQDPNTASKFNLRSVPCSLIVSDSEEVISKKLGYSRKEEFVRWINSKNITLF